MGGRSGKGGGARQEDAMQDRPLYSINISHEFLDSFHSDDGGRPTIRRPSQRELLQGVKARMDQLEAQIETMVAERQKREELATARAESKLKELNASNYMPAPKPLQCRTEREDCLRCYEANQSDPLNCASAVDKLWSCASRAQQEATATAFAS
eukprot:tig00000459_g1094.t1